MATKWPTAVDDAIREAVAAGLRHNEAHTKLKAGTLPSLDRPIAMPERTFSRKWRVAREAQAKAEREGTAEDDGPSILDRITVGIRQQELGNDVAAIVQATGYAPEFVREEVARLEQRRRDHPEPQTSPPPEHLERVKRARAMVRDGHEIEEVAAAVGMLPNEVAGYTRSARPDA